MNFVSEKDAVRRLYWISFALRFSLGLLGWGLASFTGLLLIEDAASYSWLAAETARCWLRFEQSPLLLTMMENGSTAWFMVATLAVFYLPTGGLEIIPWALGGYSLVTALAPVLAYRATRELGAPAEAALATGRLVGYSPSFIFWSGALYKEGLILVILFLIIQHALLLQRGFRPGSGIILTLCLSALFGLRFYLAAIMGLALFIGLAFGRQSKSGQGGFPPILRQGLIMGFLVVVFSVSGVQGRLEQYLSMDVEDALEKIDRSRKDLARSNSGYLQETNVKSIGGAVRFLPVGLGYFLTVPLPWQLGSLRQTIMIPETLFWVVIVYRRMFRGIRRGIGHNPSGTLFLIVSAALMCCLYALFMGNIGTTCRVRVQVWAIVAIFAGWGWRSEQSAQGNRASRSAQMTQRNPVPHSGQRTRAGVTLRRSRRSKGIPAADL